MAPMKGIYKPKNPKKYLGNATNIVFRSGLEFTYMRKLDQDAKVKHWSSEEIAIPYGSPLDNRVHRYFPDFFVEMTSGEKYLIEIKPYSQTKPPKKGKKTTKKTERRFINETMTYGKNMAKWKAAKRWCEIKGAEFKIITEKELNQQ